MSETPLDQAINVVAREMTQVEPPASMRTNVLARIEDAPRSRASLVPRWAMAAGAAVVVLAVATGVWFARPGIRSVSSTASNTSSSIPATNAAQPQSSTTPASAGLVAEAGSPAEGRTGGVAMNTNSRRLAGRGENGAPIETAGAVEHAGPAPLAQPEPLAIVALGPNAIHIADIGIEPLGDLKPITIQDIPVGTGEPQGSPIQKTGDESNTSGIRRNER